MSLLGFWRPRTATRPPLPPQPEAERDWNPGDVAKCIAGAPWRAYPDGVPCPGPKYGDLLRVVDVAKKHDVVCLSFSSFVGYFVAGHFRKLRPCATDFREQLERRSPAPPAPRYVPTPSLTPELVP